MATHQIVEPHTAWADARRTSSNPNGATSVSTPGNYVSNDSLDARLLAIGGVYTQKYIDSMTQNDKIYAIRLNDDATSIKP
jgi:hypothetical protein